MPDFNLPLLDGSGERTLQDYVDGKIGAVIVFWSAICTHCVRYDGYFNSLANSHPRIGFVAIASRYGETAEQILRAMNKRILHFPVLRDPSGSVAREWYSQQTPRCYLVDAERRLLYRGAVDNFKLPADDEYVAYLEPAIRCLLAGEPVARSETSSFGCAIDTMYYHLPKQL